MIESAWTRPHWSRSDATALLLYFVFGAFARELEGELTARGCHRLPVGVAMRRVPRTMLAHWEGHPLRGALGETLRGGDPGAFAAARRAPECLVLRGELADPDSLTYLGDTLGVIDALFDVGGVAVVDPQILEIFPVAGWRARYAGAARQAPRSHVLIACGEDDGDTVRVHTRGLRKFARPDVSLRHVPRGDVQRAGAVALRVVELEVQGMRFGDGSTLGIEGTPGGLQVALRGTLDDPAFNNTHFEIDWGAVQPAG